MPTESFGTFCVMQLIKIYLKYYIINNYIIIDFLYYREQNSYQHANIANKLIVRVRDETQ